MSYLLAVAGLALFLACGTLFFLQFNQRFPVIQPGAYLGTISGIELKGVGSQLDFYLEKSGREQPLLVAFLRKGAEIQFIEDLFGERGLTWSLPLILAAEEGNIRLIGTRVSESHYSGTATLGDREGRWSIRALKEAPVYELNSSEFFERARIVDRLESIEEAMEQQERAIVLAMERKAEIELLISDKDALRERSGAEYQKELEVMASLERKYNTLKAQVSELQSQVELARNVTSRGRLVALARESLDRENRWMDTMLKSAPSAEYLRQQEAARRAREILEINRNIAYERQRIIELRSRFYDYP